MTTATRRKLAAPPGFPIERYLAKLRHGGMNHSQWRRETCRTSPLMFACVYMDHHLSSTDTGGLVSLSEFHVAAASAARQWMRDDLGPGELRRAWVSARGSGKSTWWSLILPLWALANQHRTFVVQFGHTGTMARRHLLSLRSELAKNERLRGDFPELCAPARRGRRSVMDTQDGYLAESGAAIIVAGMDQGTLGIKLENRRPDLLIIDDGEPPDSNYSDYQAVQRIATLREAILPMSLNAPVELVGTTTRLGSALDDVLKGKQWARDEGFVPHHFPALIVDEQTGEERSAWPDRWSLEYLRSIRHTHSFMKNYQCQPVSADGTHWKESDFVYDKNGWLASHLDVKVMSIDPATTSHKRSDDTGLAIVGYAGATRQALVERATGVRVDPASLREMVHTALYSDPTIRTVLLETSNGGDWIVQALSPLPRGVKMEELRPTQAKRSTASGQLGRITELFDHYQRGRVVHARHLPTCEAQMLAYQGQGGKDDIVDAVDAAVRYLFKKYRL
jgi:hypothetical protein